ncbi:LCP family protein [Salinibacterium sp. G-O1]|uniref:LCP family protein n=1 Tax=Salinibacterium sp. G-O1 TaxID=3046208 RepID=UPI0024BADD26|nr:LCP family protein [Salinibacterium sp. G-O1]MDJ0336309.1 LCP family protein [Salinibacterium sp. G-O1]
MSELTPRSDVRSRSRSELRTRSAAATLPGIARHGRLPKSSPVSTVFKLLAAVLAVVLVSGVSIGALAVTSLTSKATVVDIPSTQGDGAALPEVGAIEGGFNVLIAGSDTRAGQGGIGGTVEDDSGELNDVTMLLHVSQDQTNAVAISFPRDMVVRIPDCTDSDGYTKPYSSEPINVALSYGGLGCVAQTVTELTGLPVQYAGLITFTGVINMADAIGGVDICVDGPMIDSETGMNLPEAGTYNLGGVDALAFLRSRASVGDGSDLTRISSQQVYLSSLVRKLKSQETLSDFSKVYALANAALSNLTVSSSLNSANTMVSIALALKNVPLEKVTFVQYPGTTGATEGIYAGKVKPNDYLADPMMEYIRNDQPFNLASVGDDRGSTVDPNAPVSTEAPVDPGTATEEAPVVDVPGQRADQYTCTVTNTY